MLRDVACMPGAMLRCMWRWLQGGGRLWLLAALVPQPTWGDNSHNTQSAGVAITSVAGNGWRQWSTVAHVVAPPGPCLSWCPGTTGKCARWGKTNTDSVHVEG